MFFDQHKHIRNTGDKERNHHHADGNLHLSQQAPLGHLKKAGGTVIAAQKSDDKRFRCFLGQSEKTFDDRRECHLNCFEQM